MVDQMYLDAPLIETIARNGAMREHTSQTAEKPQLITPGRRYAMLVVLRIRPADSCQRKEHRTAWYVRFFCAAARIRGCSVSPSSELTAPGAAAQARG